MEKADVVIVGGGLAGVSAAVSCAKEGVDVILVEKYGFLGGLATSGFIGPILGHTIPSKKIPIIRGFVEELVYEMHKEKASVSFEESVEIGHIPFNSEIMKLVLDRFIKKYSIKLFLHTTLIGVVKRGRKIKGIKIYTKKGIETIEGKIFIDSTGDGDLIFLSGGKYYFGRRPDRKVQSMGNMFRISNICEGWEKDKEKIMEVLEEERRKGNLSIYNSRIFNKGSCYGTIDFTPNMTRFSGNPLSVKDLTEGEIFLREQAYRILNICKEVSEYFKNAYISFPAQIGIRESRRLKGLYSLNENDILKGIKHPDGIAKSAYWIDIHCPLGRTKNVHLCKSDCPTDKPCIMLEKYRHLLPTYLYPPNDDYYTIPYRCLLSVNIQNLLACGRCVSATHKGISAIRVMAPCMATGQAAGIAASLSVKERKKLTEIDIERLKRRIRKQGGDV